MDVIIVCTHVCAALFLICPHYFHSILYVHLNCLLAAGHVRCASDDSAFALTHSLAHIHQFNESAASERSYYVLRFTISLHVSHSFVFNLQTPHTLATTTWPTYVCTSLCSIVSSLRFVSFAEYDEIGPKNIQFTHIFFRERPNCFHRNDAGRQTKQIDTITTCSVVREETEEEMGTLTKDKIHLKFTRRMFLSLHRAIRSVRIVILRSLLFSHSFSIHFRSIRETSISRSGTQHTHTDYPVRTEHKFVFGCICWPFVIGICVRAHRDRTESISSRQFLRRLYLLFSQSPCAAFALIFSPG